MKVSDLKISRKLALGFSGVVVASGAAPRKAAPRTHGALALKSEPQEERMISWIMRDRISPDLDAAEAA